MLSSRHIGHNTGMNWVDIVVIILAILSFAGGLKEGAVKAASSFIAMVIAVLLAGLGYRMIASLLSFLPGDSWENFLGFFITAGIISVILHFIFFIPRKIIGGIWKQGFLFRLLGGLFNFAGSIIMMAVFALVVLNYPVFGWLERWVGSSGILNALADAFGFLLPAAFSGTLL